MSDDIRQKQQQETRELDEQTRQPRDLEQAELSDAELEQQQAADLPDRENMSLVNANLAAPINAAVAANVLSDNSTAIAEAEQTAPINQGIG